MQVKNIPFWIMATKISGEIENNNDYVQYIIGDIDKMKQLLCLSIMRRN